MAWIGSTFGALLSRGRLPHSVARGAALTAISCFALIGVGPLLVFPLMLCYGLGLGITMTSISLLRSQRKHAQRTQELNRLNLFWAIGAVAAPALTAHSLVTHRIAYPFATLGATFACSTLLVLLIEPQTPSPNAPPPESTAPAHSLHQLPLLLCLTSALAVGVEASLGGWLTTYVKRTDHSISGAVTATSAFWAGLLLSRALNSTPLFSRLPAVRTLRSFAWIVAIALALLTFIRQPGALFTLALVLGFGLGPLYPTLLALLLPAYRGNRVFFFAGLGSALLPWLTGALSERAGALQAGLAIPCIAGVLLLILIETLFDSHRTPTLETRPTADHADQDRIQAKQL